MADVQLVIRSCSECGGPLPALAVALKDPHCSTDCARRAHGAPRSDLGRIGHTDPRVSYQEHRKRHGIQRYRSGCRCDVCKAAAREHQRAYRLRRKRRAA